MRPLVAGKEDQRAGADRVAKSARSAGHPLLLDLADNVQDRAVLRLLSAQTAVGKQIFAGPEVPPDRVRALRIAFDATMKDPALLAQARKKMGFDIGPVSGEELRGSSWTCSQCRSLSQMAQRNSWAAALDRGLSWWWIGGAFPARSFLHGRS